MMARKKADTITEEVNKIEIKGDNMIKEITAKKTKLSKPSWIKIKPEEMEKIVLDLVKQGETPAKIGLILRDKYGIPKAKLLGKGINEIIAEKKVQYKTKKDIIQERIEKLKKHIEKNKYDHGAKRSLTKKLWVVHNYDKKGY